MPSVITWFLPKDDDLLLRLSAQSSIALNAAKELQDFLGHYGDMGLAQKEAKRAVIQDLEHKGDEETHALIEKLNRSFITPLDKEDIYRLAVLLDDITDLINAVASRFLLLDIRKIDGHINKLSEILFRAVEEVNNTVRLLGKKDGIEKSLIAIHSLENESDEVYHEALFDLFHNTKDPIDILRYKEIYEFLEEITDVCEDISNVIGNIVVKHG